jgi:hypothetical protein
MKTLAAIITLVAISTPTQAARHAPGCNVTMPCDFTYELTTRRAVRVSERHWHPFNRHKTPHQDRLGAHRRVRVISRVYTVSERVVAHPAGCPARAFCGCGAAMRVFGLPIRKLWLAANWFKFPRTIPNSGMVAVRRHHVFVLERPLGGSRWVVYDANSGGHATRIHSRSIDGYTIVNPRG